MSRPGLDAAALRAIGRSDFLRRSPASVGGPGGHKEWLHFCVYGAGFDVLVNFSLVDIETGPQHRGNGRPGPQWARLTVLARTADGHWVGDVDTFAAERVSAPGGRVDLRFGSSSVRYDGERYHLRAALEQVPIAVDLTLDPLTTPSLAANIDTGDGPAINWLVLPRLAATGTVRIGAERWQVTGAPSYHDHNWGHFRWGQSFAWEWGFGLPDPAAECSDGASEPNPWTLVFVRLSDRAHTRVLMAAMFLWRGTEQWRVWRGDEVLVQRAVPLRPTCLRKVPPVMGLIHPDAAPDVPSRLEMTASARGDVLSASFESVDVAQVIVPNDDDLGVTVINEVSGRLSVRGEVRGERVRLGGRAIFEFLGA